MNMNLPEIIELDRKHLFQNFGNRLEAAFVRGEGAFLYDTAGREYIDFLAGISVSNIGYSHPAFNAAISEQITSLIHTSNWYFNREQGEAAACIDAASFPGRTFFSNSGTEANEAAIKLARHYGTLRSSEQYEIVSFSKSFHGRTFGGMSATAQEKIKKGFGPLVPGFVHAEYNNYEDFLVKLSPRTCAVMIELVQGEGGIIVADREFVKKVAGCCREREILLIVDEIQTGMCRTGKFFAYQHYDIKPDIITLAKALANGIPSGAIHAREDLLSMLPAGYHGSTFGGNHLATRAVCEVFRIMSDPSFLAHVRDISQYFFERLIEMKRKFSVINDVRGLGLHIGVELSVEGMPFVKRALQEGLIINCTAGNVIRIMPPLVIDRITAGRGLDILEKILSAGL